MFTFPFNRFCFSGIVAAACLAGTVQAQTAAGGPITFVVPVSASTSADIIARLISPRVSEKLGRTVVVENKVGASGIIGTQFVAKAAPNGATVLVGPNSLLTTPWLNANLPYNVKTDLIPVVRLAASTMALITRPDFPAKDVPEFIQVVRQNPGKMNFGSPGVGTPHQLLMELFKQTHHFDMTHVPYKATSGMINDMAGGRVDAAFMPVHTTVELMKAGKVKLLGTVGDERSTLFPEIPTLTEQGFRIEQFTWTAGLFLPAGTPPDKVRELEQAVLEILAQPDIQASLGKAGLTAAPEGSAAFTRRVAAELDQWRKVVETAGIRPE